MSRRKYHQLCVKQPPGVAVKQARQSRQQRTRDAVQGTAYAGQTEPPAPRGYYQNTAGGYDRFPCFSFQFSGYGYTGW